MSIRLPVWIDSVNVDENQVGVAMTSWLTVEQAAERLGVKTATVYSYISRGALTRRRAGDGRSVFDESEVEQLARRGRPRRSGNLPELVIESAVTALGEDRQYYRGHD